MREVVETRRRNGPTSNGNGEGRTGYTFDFTLEQIATIREFSDSGDQALYIFVRCRVEEPIRAFAKIGKIFLSWE